MYHLITRELYGYFFLTAYEATDIAVIYLVSMPEIYKRKYSPE